MIYLSSGDSGVWYIGRPTRKGFLESTCKESQAHASFGYISVFFFFIGPITVAHDGLHWQYALGWYSLAHCRANKK